MDSLLQDVETVMKEYDTITISELWVPLDFGSDCEDVKTKIEKILAEDIVVPGCQFAQCKRCKDGVRLKAYWAEPECNEYGSNEYRRREENHILLHFCKYISPFQGIDIQQIVVLCKKRGGDIFPYIDIVKQLKQKIDTK
jgi:hypothetical protein